MARWDELPQVTSVNAPLPPKPGATVLLNGTDERGRQQAVLAFQRFGRGKGIALTAQDTWLWQMHASIPLEDQTHENYWRQLMRWLVDGVPDHVEAHTSADRVEAGETVTITADLVDPTFVEINDARAVAHVEGPKGTIDVLLETGWIRPRGRRKAPGRPLTYGTNDNFLSQFGLENLSDLPGLEELKGAGLFDGALPSGFDVPTPSDDPALREDEDPLEPGDLDLGLAPKPEE